MPFNIFTAPVDILHDALFLQKKISVAVLRLDKIHPVVSGNKLFKLHYFLKDAARSSDKTILTFGGAYSNHLLATAFACRASGLKSIGIVRGERPEQLSSTLQQCTNYGMQLQFISREAYQEKEALHFQNELKNKWGACTIIPEGGYHPKGAQGAALVHELIKEGNYSHVCTAAGTATTTGGLLVAGNQKILSVPVLKGMNDIIERLSYLCGGSFNKDRLEVHDQYHFGGYAKKAPILIAFMNYLWQQHGMPTDFVYTAKLFFAIYDKIKNDHFPVASNIICLHTGGLQGNNSLAPGTLLF